MSECGCDQTGNGSDKTRVIHSSDTPLCVLPGAVKRYGVGVMLSVVVCGVHIWCGLKGQSCDV